jgi:ATP-dependent RNA helicase DDX3X
MFCVLRYLNRGLLTLNQFEDAGLHPAMLQNVKLCGYHAPTPIQAYTIPAVLTGRDVVGIAQTGKLATHMYSQ